MCVFTGIRAQFTHTKRSSTAVMYHGVDIS